MKHVLLAAAAVLALGLMPHAAMAKDLPSAGLSVNDVAKWLQDQGYKAQINTAKDGTKSISSATGGVDFYVDMYDCKDKPTCASIQFSAGFDTSGAFNATKMNKWNSGNRWVGAYVDDKDDPWVRMDVDLTPGGTYEGLDDQLTIFSDMLASFKKFLNDSNS